MSDQTQPQKLDLAQRITEALSRTDEPRPLVYCPVILGGSNLGQLPFHLRHLANLVEDLLDEAESASAKADLDASQLFEFTVDAGSVEAATDKLKALQVAAGLAEEDVDIADTLLFASLERHIPTQEIYTYVVFQSDWTVVGLNEPDVV